MASKVEVEVEVTSSADKFWAAVRNTTELFPKLFPQQYKSIEIVEGDGKTAGSVRLLNYAEGIPFLKFAKEKIEFADDEKKLIKYSVIEGELLKYYRSFKPTLEVVSKEDGGAVVKWSLDCEKVNDGVHGTETIKELVVQTFKEMDAHLLKN